jgi:hypothetical protein
LAHTLDAKRPRETEDILAEEIGQDWLEIVVDDGYSCSLPKQPPLLPAECLRRVLRMARLDGTMVLVLSGAFALLAASAHDSVGAGFGLVIAAAGAMELHGAGMLGNREEKGTKWLVGSQIFLLICILGYAYFRLHESSVDEMKSMIKGVYTSDQVDELRNAARESGLTPNEALRLFNSVVWGAIGIATVIYQGGMAIYYRRRAAAVSAALREGE